MSIFVQAQIYYATGCILFAYLNAFLIKKDQPIDHFANAIVHVQGWVIAFLLTNRIELFVVLPFVGKVFFDISLNLFRELPIGYVSTEKGSKLDQIEIEWFGNPFLAKLAYLGFVIATNIFLC